jgi:hypothetical protein
MITGVNFLHRDEAIDNRYHTRKFISDKKGNSEIQQSKVLTPAFPKRKAAQAEPGQPQSAATSPIFHLSFFLTSLLASSTNNHQQFHSIAPQATRFSVNTCLLAQSCSLGKLTVGAMLVRPKAVSQLASAISARSLSSRVAPVRPSLLSSASPLRSSPIQPTLRRAYADAAAAAPSPAPKKRFRFFRWAYRLTVLSGLGLTGYLSYSIYTLRHPEEQIEPDPSKKTLVILGMSIELLQGKKIYKKN